MPSPPAAKDAASRPPMISAVPESSSGLDDALPDPPEAHAHASEYKRQRGAEKQQAKPVVYIDLLDDETCM